MEQSFDFLIRMLLLGSNHLTFLLESEYLVHTKTKSKYFSTQIFFKFYSKFTKNFLLKTAGSDYLFIFHFIIQVKIL